MRASNGIALFALLLTGCGLASALAFDSSQSAYGIGPLASTDGGPAGVGTTSNDPVWEPALGPGLVLGFSDFRVPDGALKLTPNDAFSWGMYALRIGNISPGVRALDYAAANGHPIAQWKLGRMFADGEGVKRDPLRAFGYFSALADAHADDRPGTMLSFLVANAFVSLGGYYLEGIPNSRVKADPDRARELFSYAASYFGDREAQYSLARMYLEGNSVPKDPKLAARWLSLAADKGQHLAQAILGDMLIKGTDVTRRSALGLMWLTLAADAATPQETWIVEMHDEASKQASEEDRARALTLLERRLRGDRAD
jgi:TPR repeat protein